MNESSKYEFVSACAPVHDGYGGIRAGGIGKRCVIKPDDSVWCLTLNCRESFAILPPVRRVDGFEVLLGAVALQLDQVLAPTRSEFNEPAARLFAKTGLVVRPDGDVMEIRLRPRSRDHARIAWGWRPAVLGVVVRVPRCPARDGRQWLAFPGGYYVEKESCIDLEVRKGRQIKRFSIGVGVPCPGN